MQYCHRGLFPEEIYGRSMTNPNQIAEDEVEDEGKKVIVSVVFCLWFF